ncbi:hypothetical protein AZI85_00045 [Bdellovibrio bacteriovorus]|uniref:Uncharacterized protein n=1 Tax=Bdellovibrio bacteriovorus TaxID=959 RepID=A0A150WV51_BDEBC|nr:hypothetical protein [Bdellovibrio bacteriovorus]KYG70387.1 hypothetical protein AZI85_00045 [Bdellovibrio bacteriovorus]
MIRYCATILTLLLISGCSFKKGDTLGSDSTRKEQLFKTVDEGTIEALNDQLKNYPSEEVKSMQLNGSTLLEHAFERGNPEILRLLYSHGASAFTTHSSLKPYERIDEFDQDTAMPTINWLTNKYQSIMALSNPHNILSSFAEMGASCTDLLNVHAWESFKYQNQENSTKIIEVMNLPECKSSISISRHSFWVQTEIFALIKNKTRSLDYLYFLQTLKDFRSFKIDLKKQETRVTMSPSSLFKILLNDEPFGLNLANEIRIKQILNLFPEDKMLSVQKSTSGSLPLNKIEVLISESNLSEVRDTIKPMLVENFLAIGRNCFSLCIQRLE